MKTTPSARRRGFSLIEMMTSVAVLAILLVIVFQMLDGMELTYRRTRQKVNEFRDANAGFEQITRRLSQATLNTYWGYEYQLKSVGEFTIPFATKLIRQCELHFVTGPAEILFGGNKPKGVGSRPSHAMFFVTPAGVASQQESRTSDQLRFGGLKGLLNAWGYYVQFSADEVPKFLQTFDNAPKPKLRYRLMEYRQPTEYLQIYKIPLRDRVKIRTQDQIYDWFRAGPYGVNSEWNTSPIEGLQNAIRTTRIVADNIITMIIRPREAKGTGTATAANLDIAKDYLYDTRRWQYSNASTITERTRHQLPPIVDVTLVAVDDLSFQKFLDKKGLNDPEKDPELVPDDLFRDVNNVSKDFETLIGNLKKNNISYRFYTRSIRIRESKWAN